MNGLSTPELKQLAHELRWDTIRAVSKTGGHLGSSLGVVELTVALHKVFDAPEDRILWDVSHQCYPHKILTGRRSRMGTLRQQGGLSGFGAGRFTRNFMVPSVFAGRIAAPPRGATYTFRGRPKIDGGRRSREDEPWLFRRRAGATERSMPRA